MTEYYMYVGDTIQTVSVFKREDEREWPIYANTRGACEWYTFDADVYENVSPHALSEDLVEYLAHIYRARNGKLRGDSDSMYWADMVAADKPDVDLEWYEIEFINAINRPSMTPEQEDLLEWAYNKVDEE